MADKLNEIARMLDDCLEAGSGSSWFRDLSERGTNWEYARGRLFVRFFEFAGRDVEMRLGRILTPDEVMLVFNRVKQFLMARGLY